VETGGIIGNPIKRSVVNQLNIPIHSKPREMFEFFYCSFFNIDFTGNDINHDIVLLNIEMFREFFEFFLF
jgi:hypothetical protein